MAQRTDTFPNSEGSVHVGWVATVLCGSGKNGRSDGKAAEASFNAPYGIALLPDGGLYISDSNNNCIRKLDADGNMVTTVGKRTWFNPRAMCVVDDGVLLCDSGHHRIWKLSLDGTVAVPFAGSGARGALDGPLLAAQFDTPSSVCVASDGSIIIADTNNHRLRRVGPGSRTVSTIAGSVRGHLDGPAPIARFNSPCGVCAMYDGGVVVADTRNHCVRHLAADFSRVTTVAGTPHHAAFQDGPPGEGSMNCPQSVCVCADGALFVADTGNHAVRRIEPRTFALSTLCSKAATQGSNSQTTDVDARNSHVRFHSPTGLAVLPGGGSILVADGGDHTIKLLSHVWHCIRHLSKDVNNTSPRPTRMKLVSSPPYVSSHTPPQDRHLKDGDRGTAAGSPLEENGPNSVIHATPRTRYPNMTPEEEKEEARNLCETLASFVCQRVAFFQHQEKNNHWLKQAAEASVYLPPITHPQIPMFNGCRILVYDDKTSKKIIDEAVKPGFEPHQHDRDPRMLSWKTSRARYGIRFNNVEDLVSFVGLCRGASRVAAEVKAAQNEYGVLTKDRLPTLAHLFVLTKSRSRPLTGSAAQAAITGPNETTHAYSNTHTVRQPQQQQQIPGKSPQDGKGEIAGTTSHYGPYSPRSAHPREHPMSPRRFASGRGGIDNTCLSPRGGWPHTTSAGDLSALANMSLDAISSIELPQYTGDGQIPVDGAHNGFPSPRVHRFDDSFTNGRDAAAAVHHGAMPASTAWAGGGPAAATLAQHVKEAFEEALAIVEAHYRSKGYFNPSRGPPDSLLTEVQKHIPTWVLAGDFGPTDDAKGCDSDGDVKTKKRKKHGGKETVRVDVGRGLGDTQPSERGECGVEDLGDVSSDSSDESDGCDSDSDQESPFPPDEADPMSWRWPDQQVSETVSEANDIAIANDLKRTIKNFGVDFEALANVVACTPNDQLQRSLATYYSRFHRRLFTDVVDGAVATMHDDVADTFRVVFSDRFSVLASVLFEALRGGLNQDDGTKKARAQAETQSTRTPHTPGKKTIPQPRELSHIPKHKEPCAEGMQMIDARRSASGLSAVEERVRVLESCSLPTVVEILLTTLPADAVTLKDAYKRMYGRDLDRDLASVFASQFPRTYHILVYSGSAELLSQCRPLRLEKRSLRRALRRIHCDGKFDIDAAIDVLLQIPRHPVVERSHVDAINVVYTEKYGRTLREHMYHDLLTAAAEMEAGLLFLSLDILLCGASEWYAQRLHQTIICLEHGTPRPPAEYAEDQTPDKRGESHEDPLSPQSDAATPPRSRSRSPSPSAPQAQSSAAAKRKKAHAKLSPVVLPAAASFDVASSASGVPLSQLTTLKLVFTMTRIVATRRGWDLSQVRRCFGSVACTPLDFSIGRVLSGDRGRGRDSKSVLASTARDALNESTSSATAAPPKSPSERKPIKRQGSSSQKGGDETSKSSDDKHAVVRKSDWKKFQYLRLVLQRLASEKQP